MEIDRLCRDPETLRDCSAPGMTQPQPATAEQRFVVEDPCIYVLDCGCWTSTLMTLGAISGSQLVLCRFKEVSSAQKEEAAKAGQLAGEAALGQLGSKLRTFIEPLLSFTIREDQGAHSQVRIHAELHTTGTTHAAEHKHKAQLFTEPDQLVVFVPDTHLGLLDRADNFARNPGKDSKGESISSSTHDDLLKNGRILAHVLEVAKQCGAKVIQTGDFFDIWEGEADQDVYYAKRPDLANPKILERPELRSNRQERAQLAAKWIHNWWMESWAEYKKLLANIDQFLLGNHDIEMARLDHSMLKQVGLRHQEGKRWAAQHGHCFDPFNDTGPDEIKIEEVLPQVPGKAMTYSYARAERGQPLAQAFKFRLMAPPLEPIRDKDDDWDLLELASRDIPKKYLSAMSNLLRTLLGIPEIEKITKKEFRWEEALFPQLTGLKTLLSAVEALLTMPVTNAFGPAASLLMGTLAENIKEHAHPYNLIVLKHYNIHPLEFDRATSSSLHSKVLAQILADAVKLLTGADEAVLHEGPKRMAAHDDLFVYITFVAVRLNMIRRIAKDVQQQNADAYKIYMPLPSSKVRNCFVIPYELKTQGGPMPQLKLPLRVLVHSHTHAPVVVQVKLRHKSSVKKEEGYRSRAFIEVDEYDRNREPDTSGYWRSFIPKEK